MARGGGARGGGARGGGARGGAGRPPPPGGRGGYYATCHPGLEPSLAQELRSPPLRASGVTAVRPGRAGVRFQAAEPEAPYAANLWLRGAVRVLELVAEGPLDRSLPDPATALYEFVRGATDWPRLLEEGQTFKVTVHLGSSSLGSQLLALRRTRDAVCDAVREATGLRPHDPEGSAPDVPLFLNLYRDEVSLYRDTSGASLHRRGYRRGAVHRAALNEAAAGGLVTLASAGAPSGDLGPLTVDPMCGSGTLLVEAALRAARVAPGLLRPPRSFACTGWGDFDAGAWARAEERADGARLADPPARFRGNDVHPGALRLAEAAAEAAGVDHLVSFDRGDCLDWRVEERERPSAVLSNPPWGERLLSRQSSREGEEYDDGEGASFGGGEGGDDYGDGRGRGGGGDEYGGDAAELEEAWSSLGTFLRRECEGADAWLLSGSKNITRPLRMSANRKTPLTIGGMDCRLVHYSVRSRRDTVCFICGRKGHVARDCPEQ